MYHKVDICRGIFIDMQGWNYPADSVGAGKDLRNALSSILTAGKPLPQNFLQILLRCADGRNVEIFHQEMQHVG